MIVVDIESSGVDAQKNSILSIGAIDFEHQEKRFYGECRVWNEAHIDKQSLAINGFSQEQARDPQKQTDKELLTAFLAWAKGCQNHTIAGHNVQFDLGFLEATALRYHINWPLAHREIDLHSIAYFHMIRRGLQPPTENGRSALNLGAILNYAGIPEEPKPHNGLTGAKVEAEAFSRLFYDHPLIDEFKNYPIPWLKSK